MKGIRRPVSLARNLVIDFMRVSTPFVVVEKTLDISRVQAARAVLRERPGWAAIILRAFALVAREEPWLRTYYLRWPRPHFYELPASVAMLMIVRDDVGKNAILALKVGRTEDMDLIAVEHAIRLGKMAPVRDVPSLHRLLRVALLPSIIRHVLWDLGLNIGRFRANYFGSFCVSSVGNLGISHILSRAPGPTLLSYDPISADGKLTVQLQWDHRIYDGAVAAATLHRLEQVLNSRIIDELETLARQEADKR